jgi:hypothetical protein
MLRGVQCWLAGGLVAAALAALAGCGHYFYGERAAWRREAEIACLNSGAVKESPGRVRIAAIEGPGICGADFPLRVSALGETAPLGYDDEPLRPPATIPDAALPQEWRTIQPHAPPPAQPQTGVPPYGPAPYGPPPYGATAAGSVQAVPLPPAGQAATQEPGPPLSLSPPGILRPEDAGLQPALPPVAPTYPPEIDRQPGAPAPNGGPAPPYSPRPPPAAAQEPVRLAPRGGPVTIGPVEIKPPATLACPIVSALDAWITEAVQPAALRWFNQPVVEIKQISAYSCRGMNGNPNARISEHAFGNALDIAAFELADGSTVSVQYGWRGTPEEQGFLHDVQLAACQEFTTVLAPGANVYHYNHIHVDLMRRSNGRHICEPAAIPGEVVAERARALYTARHPSEPGVTGSIADGRSAHARASAAAADDRLPLAVPGED